LILELILIKALSIKRFYENKQNFVKLKNLNADYKKSNWEELR